MDGLFSNLIAKAPWIFSVTLVIAILVRKYFNKGLNRYPGPLLATFTDAWRFCSVARGKCQLSLRALHDRYGDVVRLGPNCLSFSSPEALKDIYGLNVRLTKV